MTLTIPTLLLGAWVFLTILLYQRLDGRRAALIAMIGGWAILPTGDYPEEVIRIGKESHGPTHAVSIPTPPWFNKATAIGLGCLLGAVLFDWPTLRRLRPRWFDLPAIVWVLVPIASAVSNDLPWEEGLARSRSLALAWGVAYTIGRASFADGPALRAFARAWMTAGLACLPFALAEFAVGPFWYHVFYGGHPYRFDGDERYFLHRPLVFLEHGNEFGIWSATAAVAAAWLWAVGDLPSWGVGRLRVPGFAAVASLVAACLLWQSFGSILLMLVALAPLVANRRTGISLRSVMVTGVVLLSLAIAAAGAWVVFNGGVEGLRGQVRGLFGAIGRGSFTWRLARIEEHFPQMARRPILGWGRADWSSRSPGGTFEAPPALSLWLHVTGMFGATGLVASASLMLLPIAATLIRLKSFTWNVAPWAYATLAAVLLALNFADLANNSGFLLPVLLAAGGLTTCSLDRPHARRG